MPATDYAFITGHAFSLAEKTALSTTLPLLASTSKMPFCRVWGKVYGYKRDFIVVQCFGKNIIAAPHSFFSVDGGLTFSVLDVPEEQAGYYCAQLTGVYMGDPAYEYRVTDEKTGELLTLKESQRLGWFVAAHDHECRIAPRGAFLQVDEHTVTENKTFEGLDFGAAGYLNSYVHIRSHRRPRSKLELEGVVRDIDSFDPLTEDVPAGCWSLKYDGAENLIVGSTLKFPGAVFYHQPESKLFGNLYMGNGTTNVDLAFVM
jgi:radial spoke head protein 9